MKYKHHLLTSGKLAGTTTFCSLFLSFASPSQGASILSSTYNNSGGLSIGSSQSLGSAFTMGTQNYTLDSITVNIGNINGTDNHMAFIYGDVAGLPAGPALVSFGTRQAPADVVTNYRDYTFLPSSTFTLLADETYWLVMSEEGTNNSSTWGTSSTPASGPGATFSGTAYRNFFSNGPGLPNQQDLTTLAFTVNGTVDETSAIPEPGPGLSMIALMGLAACFRKRSSRAH